MARRYEIDDAQWERIKPFLGNTPKKTGRPQADNRNLLNGVLWIMHTGDPWRDLPEYYGSVANSVQTVFSVGERRKTQAVV